MAVYAAFMFPASLAVLLADGIFISGGVLVIVVILVLLYLLFVRGR